MGQCEEIVGALGSRRLALRLLSATAAGVASLIACSTANAAWPGSNGHLAFESDIPILCCNIVYTINADGTELTTLYDDPTEDVFIDEYSPDGTTLLVSRPNAGVCPGGGSLWALHDTGIRQNDADLVLLDDPAGADDNPPNACPADTVGRYSMDGTKIAFGRTGSLDADRNGLWVMSADGTNKVRLAATTDASDVRWSYDGTQLSYHDGGSVFVVNADGTGTPVASFVEFPPSPGQISTWSTISGDGQPTSSPDGLKEVFLHCCDADSPGLAQVNIANADGSGAQRVTNFEVCPDGQFCGTEFGDIAEATWQPVPISDPSGPTITPTLSGTTGSNGWFKSPVAVSWAVADAQSGIFYKQGCDPSTVNETAGATLSCFALNRARISNRVVKTLKVDLTNPTVICDSAPVFFQGQTGVRVSATVGDALSGPAAPSVSAPANSAKIGNLSANVTGSDNAGRSTTTACTYAVKQPVVGETEIGPGLDFNPAGLAEAFSAKAKTGTITSLSIYVDPTSTVTGLVAGIYSDNGSNHPGQLLAQATLVGTPVSGTWNTVAVPPVAISACGRYWIAILTPVGGGTLRFRDSCCGSKAGKPSEVSSRTDLTTLPVDWSSGTRYRNDGPVTAWAG